MSQALQPPHSVTAADEDCYFTTTGVGAGGVCCLQCIKYYHRPALWHVCAKWFDFHLCLLTKVLRSGYWKRNTWFGIKALYQKKYLSLNLYCWPRLAQMSLLSELFLEKWLFNLRIFYLFIYFLLQCAGWKHSSFKGIFVYAEIFSAHRQRGAHDVTGYQD